MTTDPVRLTDTLERRRAERSGGLLFGRRGFWRVDRERVDLGVIVGVRVDAAKDLGGDVESSLRPTDRPRVIPLAGA